MKETDFLNLIQKGKADVCKKLAQATGKLVLSFALWELLALGNTNDTILASP